MMRKLEARGLSDQWLNVIYSLFGNCSESLLISNTMSEEFRCGTGFLQSRISSPLLYAAFIDKLAVQLRSCSLISLYIVHMVAFFYAVDIALVGKYSIKKCFIALCAVNYIVEQLAALGNNKGCRVGEIFLIENREIVPKRSDRLCRGNRSIVSTLSPIA